MQARGLGQASLREVQEALQRLFAQTQGVDPALQRLHAALADPRDARATFDRLVALQVQAQARDDVREQRALVVAMAELAAVPDFDVDLLRPWLTPFAAQVGPPRSLREEAAALVLLVATGDDEAQRPLTAHRCLNLLKAAPRGLDWAVAALSLLLNATFSREMGMAEWLLRQPFSAEVGDWLDSLRALRWHEALADWHFVQRRTEDSIAAHEAGARRAEADGLADRARASRIGVAMAWLGEKKLVQAAAAIAAYSPVPADAPAVQAVYAAGNLGWLAMLEGRWIEAEAHARRAAELARWAGMPALEQGVVGLQHARTLLALRRYPEVLMVFDAAAPLMQGRWVQRLQAERVLVQGLQALDMGHLLQARQWVREGLDAFFALASSVLLDQTDEAAARVAALGLDMGLHVEGLQALIRSRGLMPPVEAGASWPWMLRITVFDGWRVEGLATAVGEARQKADSKPVQILQYLAAHAPQAVSAQRLADALWPDAEGDKAMRALDVALTRLRAQLPDGGLVQRNEGRIALDPTRVWIDAVAVLRLAQTLREQAGEGAAGPLASGRRATGGELPSESGAATAVDLAQAERVLALLGWYRGPLLPDSREPFAQDRASFFRAQVAGAVLIGLRSAIRLEDSSRAEEIVRLSVAHGLPSDLVRSVIAELQALGERSARHASRLGAVFDLARR